MTNPGAGTFPFPEAVQIHGYPVTAGTVVEILRKHVTARRWARIVRTAENRSFQAVTVLEAVHDPGNLHAVYRSAEAFGLPEINTIGAGGEAARAPSRVSQGAENWLHVQQWSDSAACFRSLRGRGFRILATGPELGTRPLRGLKLKRPVAIVLGNEHSGVKAATAAAADGHLLIPMFGMVQSLNISVAAGLFLSHCRDQLSGRKDLSLSIGQQTILQAHYCLCSVNHAQRIVARNCGLPRLPPQN